MGVTEVTLIEAGIQVSQGITAFLGKISPTNAYAIAAKAVGQQFFANLTQGLKLGLVAAQAEFTASNTQEKAFVDKIVALPPIT